MEEQSGESLNNLLKPGVMQLPQEGGFVSKAWGDAVQSDGYFSIPSALHLHPFQRRVLQKESFLVRSTHPLGMMLRVLQSSLWISSVHTGATEILEV